MKNLTLFLLSVGYKKILHFLRLDNREPDFIKRYFLKGSLGDFSCRGELFQNTPYFFKRMGLK
ncbi:hypothetical protein RGC45_00405 [Helicobacter pylori]|uniref:hypothetical protein n=1 Tax=Helicobacter pylori TaxID=210 RepID=UPI00292991F1|nr:hypothetical protein [Helicobacter pylori]MDU9727567.1 hypothetical protein [Helicobacter pylori]